MGIPDKRNSEEGSKAHDKTAETYCLHDVKSEKIGAKELVQALHHPVLGHVS